MNDTAVIPLSELSWNLIYDGMEVISAKTLRIGTVDLGASASWANSYYSSRPSYTLDEDEKGFITVNWHGPGSPVSIQPKCVYCFVFRRSDEVSVRRRHEAAEYVKGKVL